MTLPRLLVIDDEAQIRRMLTRTLSQDFDVTCAASVELAIAMLDDEMIFDAILCDLNLPRLSGHDFYDLLESRSDGLAARVVIVTGTEPAPQDAFAMMLGDRYVMKTGPLAELIATLRKVAFPRLSSPCAPFAAA